MWPGYFMEMFRTVGSLPPGSNWNGCVALQGRDHLPWVESEVGMSPSLPPPSSQEDAYVHKSIGRVGEQDSDSPVIVRTVLVHGGAVGHQGC